MKNEATKACGPPDTTDQPMVTVLNFAPEKYRDQLADYELTKEQEDELLTTLWHIMRTFVELGWGLDSVQLLSAEKAFTEAGNTTGDSVKTLSEKNPIPPKSAMDDDKNREIRSEQ